MVLKLTMLVRAAFEYWNVLNCFADSQSKSTIVNIAPAEETRKTDDWFAEVGAAQRYG